MSSTFKINGSFVTDPIKVEWQTMRVPNRSSVGGNVYSLFPSAILTFNALTSSQWNAWVTHCDVYPTVLTGFLVPRRTDGAMTNNPETFTMPGQSTSATRYMLHLLEVTWSSALVVHSARILAYMVAQYDVGGGGG